MGNFVCVSINHKLCDSDFRGKFAFDESNREEIIISTGGVLLCTCNRAELYFTGSESDGLRIFSRFGGVSEGELKRRIMIYRGDGAIFHLFKVACGIESMVIGEDEILGQLKSAYSFTSERCKLPPELNLIFRAAITTAKKIKTETVLSKTAVSTATLAAKHAARHSQRVMLIGATGKIGSVILKDLLSYKGVNVVATSRSHNTKIGISSDSVLTVIPYEHRYEHIQECGAVISATSGPHFTLTADRLSETSGKRLYIDLAVPRDIDPNVVDLKGAELYDIDYFTELAHENNVKKQDSINQANAIISHEIDELKKQLLFRELLPEFGEITASIAKMPSKELFYRLKSELSFAAFEELIWILKEF